MGRRKDGELIRSCFRVLGQSFECKYCGCKLPSDHLGNYKSHLQRKHRHIFEALQQQQEQLQQEQQLLFQRENSNDNKKIKISLELSQVDVRDMCAEFVTECGVALRFFNSTTFGKLFEPIFEQLNLPKINRNNISEIINRKFKGEISLLKTELRNKIISVKIDSAQRLSRNIVCLNAQYLKNGNITIKTLAMQNLQEKHTASNLKNFILKSLQRYDIRLEQIYSITSDNGSNMVACGTLLQYESREEHEVHLPIESEAEDDILFENFDSIFEDAPFYTCMSENFSSIVVLRCAAHTIQLSVHDFMKNESVRNSFTNCRNLVKKLRTPAMHRLLASQNLLPPVADCPTRWSYSYELLKGLKNLQEFLENNMANVEIDWNFIDRFLMSFEIIKKTTEKLQYHNLLFGDFIKIYLEMILTVKKESNDSHMSRILLKSLNDRKDKLLRNPTVAAAIYLDPRLRRLLLSPEFVMLKPVALAHLRSLQSKINSLNETGIQSLTCSINQIPEDNDDLLGSLLNQIWQSETPNVDANEQFSEVENFNDNCELKTELRQYWEEKKYSHQTLYNLYKIIHAAPATQVSVERAFSTLRYVLNDYRSSLNDDLMEAILILRLNSQ